MVALIDVRRWWALVARLWWYWWACVTRYRSSKGDGGRSSPSVGAGHSWPVVAVLVGVRRPLLFELC